MRFRNVMRTFSTPATGFAFIRVPLSVSPHAYSRLYLIPYPPYLHTFKNTIISYTDSGGRLVEAIENDTLVVTEMLAEGREDFLKSPILVTFLSPVRCVLVSVCTRVCTDNSPFAVLREG